MRNPRHVVVALAVALVTVVHPARPADAATTCTQDWRPAEPGRTMPPRPSPEHRAFDVFCDGHFVSSVWLAPRLTPFTVATAARDVIAGARYPSVEPAVNPTRGITGLASWFWATSDDTPVRMLPGNGPGIDLELRIRTVRWRFGDGTTGAVTGWGTAYPSPSPVQHVFERKGVFTVDAEVQLVGRARAEELDVELPGSHTVALRHEVAEVRSLLHAR